MHRSAVSSARAYEDLVFSVKVDKQYFISPSKIFSFLDNEGRAILAWYLLSIVPKDMSLPSEVTAYGIAIGLVSQDGKPYLREPLALF